MNSKVRKLIQTSDHNFLSLGNFFENLNIRTTGSSEMFSAPKIGRAISWYACPCPPPLLSPPEAEWWWW